MNPGEQVKFFFPICKNETKIFPFFFFPKAAADRSFWDNFVQDFYSPTSTCKLELLNSETEERKVFGNVIYILIEEQKAYKVLHRDQSVFISQMFSYSVYVWHKCYSDDLG